MGAYLIKRLAFFLPTLLLISVLAFFLSKTAPGDPVDLYHQGGVEELTVSLKEKDRIYHDTRELLQLNKPSFYLAFTTQAYPDTLYRIMRASHRQSLRSLIREYGNWPEIQEYYRSTRTLEVALQSIPDTLAPSVANRLSVIIRSLPNESDPGRIIRQVAEVDSLLAKAPALFQALQPQAGVFLNAWQQVTDQSTRQTLYQPALHWYGFDNQYHQWLRGIFRGDFGRSYRDGQPASAKIGRALRWTLLINGLAILLAYGLAIPLGVSMAVRKDSRYDRGMTVFLFVLYSLPSFWIGTLLLILFTTPEYGLQFFSITRINDAVSGGNWWQQAGATLRQITLPVVCLVYGSLAFIARQMRGGMLEVVSKDYIRTARAKGLTDRIVIWKHAFRNALFPLITLFASLFPALLAGSVVIEYIFNIPGMGKLTVDSIRNQDWPVVYVLLLLSAVVTMAGILLADIMYAVADPRVRYLKTSAK